MNCYPVEYDSIQQLLLSQCLNVSLSDANCVDTFLAKLVNVTVEIGTRIFSEHLLQYAKITLVINFSTRLEGLKRFDHLNSKPITLVSNFTDDHLIEPLQASLFKYGQHAIVSYLELVAVVLCKLEL